MERSEAPICVNSTANSSPCKQNKQKNHLKPLTVSKTLDLGLTDYSERDAPWDTHRSEAQTVMMIYDSAEEFARYGERISGCSGVLRFGLVVDPETGELRLKLREAQFCRVRNCPVCQWRRSLMWQARFYQSLPKIEQEHPKGRWLFLTLTVPNCPVNELRNTLQGMNKAWQRLIKRKEFKPVLGFIRTTEVTHGKDGNAHPHFHALLLVKPSYFGHSYVTQAQWLDLWRSCMRDESIMMVDIRVVKNRDKNDPKTGLQRAAAETLKYAVKPADMINNPEWFLELTRQVHKLRFMATGGVLKDVLRVDDETDQDLIVADEVAEQPDDGARLAFSYRPSERRYRRFARGDKPAGSEGGQND